MGVFGGHEKTGQPRDRHLAVCLKKRNPHRRRCRKVGAIGARAQKPLDRRQARRDKDSWEYPATLLATYPFSGPAATASRGVCRTAPDSANAIADLNKCSGLRVAQQTRTRGGGPQAAVEGSEPCDWRYCFWCACWPWTPLSFLSPSRSSCPRSSSLSAWEFHSPHSSRSRLSSTPRQVKSIVVQT
ncbi:hypothetical protein V5799_010055 [Amblyomma americanum]|uniref:Uncharacterized protein n=1 Tax=Amblyomma americanum TaxID=6943 RepID=A0AAQ4FAC7_AMBAM